MTGSLKIERDMQEKLPILLALQELDLQIRSLTVKKKALEEILSEEKARFTAHLENFEREKSKLKKFQSAIKEYEVEEESLQERRRKLEEQQAAVKTNQEYKALNKEILDTCAHVDRTEEAMLKKLEEIDVEKERHRELENQLKAEEEKLNQNVSRVELEAKELEAQISELDRKREEIIPAIDRSTLRTYQKVLNRTGGPAVVPINNRSCGGCHLSVTAQIENLTRRNEELIICENCSRILYYKETDSEEGE